MAKASQVVIMEGEYYIIKSPNGKVLEVKDFNTENGAGIQLWSYAGHPWQQWQFVDAGEGRWRIQNRFTGKMIDLALGGVVGVNFGNAFLRADGRRDSDTPLTTIVRHIDYLINIMGEDHVALGSDFDGITLPDELGDVAGLPRLINTLRASGYDQLVLDKLLWRNWLRVLKNVWQQ